MRDPVDSIPWTWPDDATFAYPDEVVLCSFCWHTGDECECPPDESEDCDWSDDAVEVP